MKINYRSWAFLMLMVGSMGSSFMNSTHTKIVLWKYSDMILDELKESLFDTHTFKSNYDKYRSYFEEEKNLEINQLLKQQLHDAMKQIKQNHPDFEVWQNTIKNRVFLKNTNKTKVLTGVGLLMGAGLLTATLGKFIITCGKTTNSGIALANSITGLLFADIVLGVSGFQQIMNGWNYTDYLKAINEDINILDANYAYAFPNQEKLSKQIIS